ncbi:ABC transporter substrate-binding protein [Streptomyces montanus]|uniref:ABC transporter substrate-binding protein n=1 Tax=Streptomyces montanus TaxID=2580423 RepID=A0A5R9FH63_9ACTN|nr:ABC transporter substrate-binding protein [Streptomyces montanus]TLS43147.1 ABC transporter substrate-binding protein [Streptomyces montanus]
MRCPQDMRRRGFLAAALLAAGYAGAGSAAPRRGSGRGPLTLATGRDLTGYLQHVLDGWNRAHPAEAVTLVQLPEAADEVHAQMVESLRAGRDRFDVLNIDVTWTAEFASAGWISPVDPDRLPLNRMLPSVLDTATFRGRLYAAPYVTNAGLLYYREDLLEKAGLGPPRTWAELEHAARTVAPRYGVDGYAGQFLPYEGLTVNVDEAVESAGGSILDPDGRSVTVGSAAAREGLGFLVRGVRDGWIPQRALTFKEEESRLAFQTGTLLFLRNWPYVYDMASVAGSAVAGRFGVTLLPGPDGQGASVLGGSNLAVTSRCRHPETAADLLAHMTGEEVQRQVLTRGSLPPVLAALYTDRDLTRRYPYLPALEQSVRAARVRPKSAAYEQVSLAVAAVSSDALRGQTTVAGAISRVNRELRAITRSA